MLKKTQAGESISWDYPDKQDLLPKAIWGAGLCKEQCVLF